MDGDNIDNSDLMDRRPQERKPVLIETVSSAAIVAYGFVFLVALVGWSATGCVNNSDVFQRKKGISPYNKKLEVRPDKAAEVMFRVKEMEMTNQFAYISFLTTVDKGQFPEKEVEYTQQYRVEVKGCKTRNCDNDDEADWDTLLHHQWLTHRVHCKYYGRECGYVPIYATEKVEYSTYKIKLAIWYPEEFTNTTGPKGKDDALIAAKIHVDLIEPSFTAVSVNSHYIALALTTMVLAYFCWSLRGAPYSFLQSGVLTLLLGLLLYNNPFYALDYAGDSTVWTQINVIFQGCYVGLVLFMTLSLVEELYLGLCSSRESDRKPIVRTLRYFLPKAALTSAFVALEISAYTYARLNMDVPKFGLFAASDSYESSVFPWLVTLMVLYAVYLLYLLAHVLVAAGRLEISLPLAVTSVLYLCVGVAVATVVLVLTGSLYPLPSKGYQMTFSTALYNLFAWTLALAYSAAPDRLLQATYGTGGSSTVNYDLV